MLPAEVSQQPRDPLEMEKYISALALGLIASRVKDLTSIGQMCERMADGSEIADVWNEFARRCTEMQDRRNRLIQVLEGGDDVVEPAA